MKKVLSLFMAVLMVVCSFSFCITAEAADNDCVTVTVTGMQMNYTVKSALDSVNALRKSNKLAELQADKTLTAAAKRYAAMLEIHYDDEFHMADGRELKALLPKIETTQAMFAKYVSDITSDAIQSYMKAISTPLDTADYVKSVGIAAFKSNAGGFIVIAVSLDDAASVQTDFSNQAYNANEKLNAAYISAGSVELRSMNNGKYALSSKVRGDGLSSAYFDVKSKVNYVSSKPSVFKVKGTNGYVKNAGSVTVTAKTASGKKAAQSTFNCTSTSYKPYISSLKSKKKQLTVKWSKNISNASGYEVQYSTDKKFKKGAKTVTVKGKKNASKTVKKLKRKKTYYVRVRAYVNQGEGEKMYSPWSAKKSVKVK